MAGFLLHKTLQCRVCLSDRKSIARRPQWLWRVDEEGVGSEKSQQALVLTCLFISYMASMLRTPWFTAHVPRQRRPGGNTESSPISGTSRIYTAY